MLSRLQKRHMRHAGIAHQNLVARLKPIACDDFTRLLVIHFRIDVLHQCNLVTPVHIKPQSSERRVSEAESSWRNCSEIVESGSEAELTVPSRLAFLRTHLAAAAERFISVQCLSFRKPLLCANRQDAILIVTLRCLGANYSLNTQ